MPSPPKKKASRTASKSVKRVSANSPATKRASLTTSWERYKVAWSKNQSPRMDVGTFNELFFDSGISHEAITLLSGTNGAAVRATLEPVVAKPSEELVRGLADHDRRSVWSEVAAADPGQLFDRLLLGRRRALHASSRRALVAAVVRATTERHGRQQVRVIAPRWWRDGDLIEEEQESLLETLADCGVLTGELFRDLGASARAIAERLARFGRLSAAAIEELDVARPSLVEGSRPGNRLAPRIGTLLQPVLVDLDIKDAGLQPNELASMSPIDSMAQLATSALLDRTLHRLQHEMSPHAYHEISAGLASFGRLLTLRRTARQVPEIRFPLIRLLHLRLLLEAPSLSPALRSPEESLIPEVLSYTLGRDPVAYSPEIRVSRDMDKRWRARWAELAGESMAVMFLESALDLDLTLLERIPERSGVQTPDFQAATHRNERIVFEAKGATSWKSHKQQRGEALQQLGKGKPGRGASASTYPGEGRAFAMAFFAAQQGDERASILHVEDPPFPFDEFFREGWQDRARRSHYAAVLEAARLDGVATAWRKARPTEGEADRAELFELPGGRGGESRFVGSFLPVVDLAKALRYQDMDAVRALRVFTGVRLDLFHLLRRNEMPPSSRRDVAQPDGPRMPVMRSGTIERGEPGGPARGIYSELPDGSFLAVELD